MRLRNLRLVLADADGLTAKAAKASTQEMVGAFTSGYGIFKPIMADMTDMEWATRLWISD